MLKITVKKDSITTVQISEVQGPPLPLSAGTELYTMKSLEFSGNVGIITVRNRENDKRRMILALEGYQRFRALPVERSLILSV